MREIERVEVNGEGAGREKKRRHVVKEGEKHNKFRNSFVTKHLS